MLKNNILGCIGQVILVLLTFLFISLIHMGEGLSQFFYSGFIGKIFFILVPALYYWLFGKLMSRSTGWAGLLFPGLSIFGISLILGFIGFSALGSQWINLSVGESMWRFPLEVFLLPQYILATLWNLPKEEYTLLILSCVPGLIYTISLLGGRHKIRQRRKRRGEYL
ncbi:MAG: hypothetical protein Q4Q07_00890 [Tissierellia bacterium]|nr:hypothetical protein [Tissierellia bacterium]